MAFSKDQLKSIEQHVGGLCERRVPPRARDQVRLAYDIDRHNVLIRESRPDFRDPSLWIEMDVAKLRYIASSNKWRLYWKRASDKWWPYTPSGRSTSLSAMLKEIDADEYGCFFG